MYALSKYANGNIEEVLQKIDEGRHLTELVLAGTKYSMNLTLSVFLGQFAVNEQLRLQTLNMYFGAQQQNSQNQQNSVPATRECG